MTELDLHKSLEFVPIDQEIDETVVNTATGAP
jgi:hypothetical protein